MYMVYHCNIIIICIKLIKIWWNFPKNTTYTKILFSLVNNVPKSNALNLPLVHIENIKTVKSERQKKRSMDRCVNKLNRIINTYDIGYKQDKNKPTFKSFRACNIFYHKNKHDSRSFC